MDMVKNLHQRLIELGFVVDEWIPKYSAQIMKTHIATYEDARDPFIIIDGELLSDVEEVKIREDGTRRIADICNSYVFYSKRK